MIKIIIIILVVLYTLNPYDIIPDLLIGWGWLDDLVILGLLWRYLYAIKRGQSLFGKYFQQNRRFTDDGAGGRYSQRYQSAQDDHPGLIAGKNGIYA